MKYLLLTTVLIKCTLLFEIVKSERYDELPALRRLYKELLVNGNYDSHARPVINPNTTVNVSLSGLYFTHLNLDTKSHVLKVKARFFLRWKDEHLTWDPSAFDGLNSTLLPFDKVWTPDIFPYVVSYADGYGKAYDKRLLSVNSSGFVELESVLGFQTECYLNIQSYPFDRHVCRLYFGSSVYSGLEVNITSISPYSGWCDYRNVEFKCFKPESKLIGKRWRTIIVTLPIERQQSSYRYLIVMPYVTATLLALAMFFVPLESKLRLFHAFLAIFILMSLLLYMNDTLGFGGAETPFFVRCTSFGILSIGIAAILFSFLAVFMQDENETEAPQILVIISSMAIVRLVLQITPDIRTQSKGPKDEAKRKDWMLVTTFLDRLIFIAFISALIYVHTNRPKSLPSKYEYLFQKT